MARKVQEEILSHLKAGFTISPSIAAQEFNCYCLAAVIKKLRDKEYEILAEIIPGTKSKQYYMPNARSN